MKQILSENAPKAFGPYSQAVENSGMVFVSGQLGMDPTTSELKTGITDQTKQVLENLKAILEAAGLNFSHVVRCDVFLTDLNDFKIMNGIYSEYFTSDPKPARQTVQVAALPKGALVEISCIAVKN